MKKFLILSLIATFSLTVYAQKGVVKDANRSLKSDDLKEARVLIKQAIENHETANDPDTWKLYGDIGNKAFDLERTKEMIGKKANADVMYKGLIESYVPYLKADSLAQLPDSRGRVKNKVRKDISSVLKLNYPFYINGGLHFNEKNDFKQASEFFEIFWDIPNLDMFEGDDYFKIDSTYQIIKYYAIITSIQDKNNKRALNLIKRAIDEPFIENSAYQESALYELLASEYIQSGDTLNYMEVLNVGASKFPKNKYFIPNLINVYIAQGEHDKAIEYLDRAIKNDSDNACLYNTIKADLFSINEEFEKAVIEYKKALLLNDNFEKALEGLGKNYFFLARNLQVKSGETTDRNIQSEYNKKTIEYYKLSLPHLEKLFKSLKERQAEETAIKNSLIILQNVYYNLSNLGVDKSKELETVEKELAAEPID